MEYMKGFLRFGKSKSTPSEQPIASLCERCQKIPLEGIFAGDFKKGFVFEEARSIGEVEECIQSCALCRLVSRSFDWQPQIKDKSILSFLGLKRRKTPEAAVAVKYSVGRHDAEVLVGHEKNALRLTVLGRERSFLKVRPFVEGSSLLEGHLVSHVSPNFELIKAWISNCVAHHGASCETLGWAQPSQDPTNAFVINVIDEVLRPLVVPKMKFVALSYVVGPSRQSQRNRRHLRKFATSSEALPLKALVRDLPTIVKDAMRFVRLIGEQFLWVDCLSISDRDEEHKLSQIRQMHRIYSSALLTIVAADGADGDTGLSGISPQAARIDQLSEEYAPDKFLAELLPVDETAQSSSIWNSRSWCLQERLLSRRCVIFCKGQVYWRCKKDAFGEDYPLSAKPRGKAFVDQMPFRLDILFPERTVPSNDSIPVLAANTMSSDLSSSDLRVLFAAYCWVVAEYSRRRLTFAEDINTAFDGIDVLLCENLGTTPWWGSPQSLLHRALLWCPGYANVNAAALSNERLKRRCSRRLEFPSWAWCGWIGRITYFSLLQYVLTLGGSLGVDLFFSNTEVVPYVAWSRYEGGSMVVINRSVIVELSGKGTESGTLPSEGFTTSHENHELGVSLDHELTHIKPAAIDSTADNDSFERYIFTYARIWRLSQFAISEHPSLQRSQYNAQEYEMIDHGGYGYLDSEEVLDPADVYVMVVSRTEMGARRRANEFFDWSARYADGVTHVYDVLYVVFDEKGDFKGQRARRVIMPVTFINRSKNNFKPSTEIGAINAHRAHLRYEKKRKAARETACRRNVQVFSCNEATEQYDAEPIQCSMSLIAQHIGSLRDDPFWTMPVDNSYDAMMSFDYLFQVICPFALSLNNLDRKQFEVIRMNILETRIYCSAMIALGLMLRSLHMDNTKRLSRATMYHLNNAIVALRGAVEDPLLGTSDLVLSTICTVAIVYRLLNDYAAYYMHVGGVRRIVDLRGGLDSLVGWGGFLKIAVVGMFESEAVLQRQLNQRDQDDLGPSLTYETLLEYPSYPPAATLRDRVSHYPQGIRALALGGRLSFQFLNFFEVFFDWYIVSNTTPGPHDSMTELGHEILSMPRLTSIERLLAVTIQAYINWLERTIRNWSNFSSEHEVAVHIRALKAPEGYADACTDETRAAVAWCCLMLRDTTETDSLAWGWAVERASAMSVLKDREEELDRLFLPRPGGQTVDDHRACMRVISLGIRNDLPSSDEPVSVPHIT
ncbi:hypothetical protein H2200_012283 [Cladophialophora chaetospira]|uniref:Heterokaryon incompatibility domain-containing protein n=1 Tax=Cladophialophora chaetospira TaxID=386627 RepID=A0AA39CC86_9EURO|nr:hypothetical protein H2200_012283 [Cladophialophora chaetospira]